MIDSPCKGKIFYGKNTSFLVYAGPVYPVRPCRMYMKNLQILCNGQPQEVAPGTTLARLLEDLTLPADSVVAEINKKIIDRDQYATLKLAQGDQVELIRFVGGG